MYTTPRKVKQESRLRRTHSLSNGNENNHMMNGLPNNSAANQNSPGAFETINDVSTTYSLLDLQQIKHPPPYKLPPDASSTNIDNDVSLKNLSQFSTFNSIDESSTFQVDNNQIYQTHSKKFPIVKEVFLSTEQLLQNTKNIGSGSNSPLQQNKLLEKKIPTSGWTNERKAFTLDSRTGKAFQEKLARNPPQIIPRRNSLDLEKFIQVFNEEQILMSSMQGRHLSEECGIDNPGLDLGPHQIVYSSNSGKNGLGYYNNDSNSSSNSQSLSLSSSNADSIDTVIYKTPTSSQQLSKVGSIRDWQEQRSMDPSSTQMDYNNQQRGDNNTYRDTNTTQFLDHRSFQVQQGTSYQPLSPYGAGSSNYGLEYRSNHQPQQQNLSPQSNHSSHQNTSNGLTLNPLMMRTGNNISNGPNNILPYNGHPPLPPTLKSPLLQQKQFSTSTTGSTDLDSLDKTKESTKLFHTKTYNHLKDMISSRFGNTKGVLTSGHSNSGSERTLNNNGHLGNGGACNNGLESNGGDSGNVGLPNSSNSYTTQHYHYHNGSTNNAGSYAHQMSNGGQPYYVVPSTPSPSSYNTPNGLPNGTSGPPFPNSYKSPVMNDRKNVNTSFRKAIHQSTQKSNLTDDSLQMRTILESQSNSQQNLTNSRQHTLQNGGIQFSSGSSLSQPESHQAHQNHSTGSHVERAQRALDKLLIDSNGGLHPSHEVMRSHEVNLQNGSTNQQQRLTFHPSETSNQILRSNPNNLRQQSSYQAHPVYQTQNTGVLSSNPRHSLKNSEGSLDNTIPVISYSAKPSVTMTSSNNPSLDIVLTNPDDQPPPPLPTIQLPQVQKSTLPSTLGLPLLSSIRENGDGSSGMELISKCGNEVKLNALKLSLDSSGPLSPGENLSSSSECEVKGSQRGGSGQSHTTTDSGHGTVKSPQHSGNGNEQLDGLMNGHHIKFNENVADSISSGNDSEWVDIIEPEIRQILELERLTKSGKPSNRGDIGQSQFTSNSQQLSSRGGSNVTNDAMGPSSSNSELHKPNPHNSPSESPKMPKKFDLSNYNKKQSHEVLPGPSSGQGSSATNNTKGKSSRLPTSTILRSNSGSGGQRSTPWNTANRQRLLLSNDKGKASTIGRKDLVSQTKAGKLTRNAMSQILYSLHDEGGELTSTTTGLDLESMLDGQTENTSEDDDDLSTTIDTTDAHAIRRQLESLESMYTEVLKVLGGKKHTPGSRYPPPPPSTELRNTRRRPYGSMSSLPSSVSSRPFRESKKRMDDKKKVKDIKSINRRFQRLESHVVTLARSVAHLSSEMRTQHLMVQEMESIRNELTQLRTQVLKTSMQNQSAVAMAAASSQGVIGRGSSGRHGVYNTDWTSFRNALPSLTNPCRVRKLTKFFGDEPPLIRIFLKKLGYEKYASLFEQERIGIMELPYLTEERLQKMGIPMGPRLRILQEAHLCLKPGAQFTVEHQHVNGNTGNLSVYVV